MREIIDIFFKKIGLKKTLFICLLITFFCFIKPTYSKDFNYYEDLVKDWIKIFPDQNRNAAGPKFFKHILDKETRCALVRFIDIMEQRHHIE